MNKSDSIMDIRDPEIDVEEIMKQIQTRIQERRLEMQLKGQDDAPPNFASFIASVAPVGGDLQNHLQQMQQSGESIFVSVSVRDQHWPLLNSWINRLKEAFHTLVVIYVNSLAGRQAEFNRATLGAISEMTRRLEEVETRQRSLENETRYGREPKSPPNAERPQ